MPGLSQTRCLRHIDREAAARCPECRQSFCRECITEHDGRVICASCLRRLSQATVRSPRPWTRLTRPIQMMVGFALTWLIFYSVGQVLLRIPTEWHEGAKALEAIGR